MKIKKIISMLFLTVSLSGIVVLTASAQGTVIPKLAPELQNGGCTDLINNFEQLGGFNSTTTDANGTIHIQGLNGSPGDLVACGIQTGRISLPMIPYFITFFSNYLLGLVSLISLLFIVIGGLYYNFGAMTAAKDKGKAFIKNAIIGMCVAFLAWAIVNVIMAAITG